MKVETTMRKDNPAAIAVKLAAGNTPEIKPGNIEAPEKRRPMPGNTPGAGGHDANHHD